MRLAKHVGALLMLALVLGVGTAGGRALAPATPVLVEVLGQGKVVGAGFACGRGSEQCYPTFTSGGTVTLSAVQPAPGWSFAGWGDTGDTNCFGSLASDCVVPVDGSQHQVTATFSSATATRTRTFSVGVPNNTGGKVTGGRISCGSGGLTACSWEVVEGSTLTVLEKPDPGFVFTGWGGNCGATDTSCTVPMDRDFNVTASFAAASTPRTLTVNVTGNGTVTGGGINCSAGATCSSSEPVGSFVTLVPTPATGYTFIGWTGDCVGSASTCTVQMTADRRVTASFDLTFQLSVSVTGNGNVTGSVINCGSGGSVCSANLSAGATVTLTAAPASGATFTGWGGACSGTTTTCTVTMNAAKTVTATFASSSATTFPLVVSVTGSGTVTGSGINCGNGATACSANIAANTTVTLVAAPASGATFSGWSGVCSGTTTTCNIVMSTTTSVRAVFTQAASTYRLSVSVKGSGRVLGRLITCGAGGTICAANEPANSTVALTATPVAGAAFQGWGGACSGIAKTCSVVMDAAKTVSASFTAPPAKATLTIKVLGKGTVSAPGGKCVGKGKPLTCKQVYLRGRVLTLTARPAAGGGFRGWSGDCTGKKSTCTVALTKSRSVTASFSN